jgi:hypothetical protein
MTKIADSQLIFGAKRTLIEGDSLCCVADG